MTTAIEQEADKIALNGAHAGSRLWIAIEQAIEVGLPGREARGVFDALVEQITREMPDTEGALFGASAFEALPASATSTADRATIDSDAWRAYEVFVGDAREAAAEDRADYYRDLARDEVAA
jgi:hypothetical protein